MTMLGAISLISACTVSALSGKFTVTPKVANKFKEHFQNNTGFYAQAAVLNVFLSVIADGSRWQYRLLDLFNNSPDIQLEKMGFFKNWLNDPFWRILK